MVVHAVRRTCTATPSRPTAAWSSTGVRVSSYPDLVDLIAERLSDDETRGRLGRLRRRPGHRERVPAPAHRLQARPVPAASAATCRPTAAHGINTAESAQVTVVDLHNLPDRAQRFVVGVILKPSSSARRRPAPPGRCCSSCSTSSTSTRRARAPRPIKEVLLDIAERGRSLGVILIGAQQTASEVERRIIANSAIRVVGRLDAAEAARPEYGFLPPAQRQRALIAKPGTMFVNQPEIPVPLVVEFPFPAWATRPVRGRRRRPAPRCARWCSRPTRSRWSARPRRGIPTTRSRRGGEDPAHLRLARREGAEGTVRGSTSSSRCWPRSWPSPRPSGPTWSSSPATSSTRRRRAPRRKKVVVRALTRAARHAGAVVVVAGNHDHDAGFDACALVRRRRHHAAGPATRAEDRVISGLTAAARRCAWRAAVRVAAVRDARRGDARADAARRRRLRRAHRAVVAALTAGFAVEAVNVVAAHCRAGRGARGRRA